MSTQISSLTPSVLVETGAVRVAVLPERGRLSLRSRGDLAALNKALGLTLPDRIGRRVIAGETEVIRLGPDEWTILVPVGEVTGLIAACDAIYADHPYSLVDISGREITLQIEGPKAAELLALGCARDVEIIPVGEGRRTVCDGTTVILWRDSEDRFRMDIWNSFAPHLGHLFEIGSKELAAEIALS
ncbi:sarcosine oxidase subunit gamma family protein [Rhizobium leguminosarum]|uniref:Sarcosine oxidase subunit gamma family protein n=1 Tax=Rhizobium leguminosarum TaxID=384 RepID=A0A7K3VGU9_RHILE|nr:sarcosine oxidase subunit gamma family protein [Rhizobium leguminosarum]NEK16389.1 sarcosine oxidase subunit gamma family protein [Rhizobium leguminosarum]NEK36835.1 sarcosine oxidase subunit gamma family protein [Rhizobium leguminosarum]